MKSERPKFINSIARSIQKNVLTSYTLNQSSLLKLADTQAMLGITIDDSAHDPNHVYIWAYWIPLCVPFENLYFNFGSRMQHLGSDLWDMNNLSIPDLCDHLTTPIREWENEVADRERRMPSLIQMTKTNGNLHAYRSLFFTYLWEMKIEDAISVHTQASRIRWTKSWQMKIISEMDSVRNLCAKPTALQKLLCENIEVAKTKYRLK